MIDILVMLLFASLIIFASIAIEHPWILSSKRFIYLSRYRNLIKYIDDKKYDDKEWRYKSKGNIIEIFIGKIKIQTDTSSLFAIRELKSQLLIDDIEVNKMFLPKELQDKIVMKLLNKYYEQLYREETENLEKAYIKLFERG